MTPNTPTVYDIEAFQSTAENISAGDQLHLGGDHGTVTATAVMSMEMGPTKVVQIAIGTPVETAEYIDLYAGLGEHYATLSEPTSDGPTKVNGIITSITDTGEAYDVNVTDWGLTGSGPPSALPAP